MPEITDAAGTLKKRIRNGDTVLGVSVPMTMSIDQISSIVEKGPYDFVGIDIQHAPYDENVLVSFCEKAAELGVHTQFRIKHTQHTYLIGNYLDLGPTGIEVPQVETMKTVDDAVANFYYRPFGVRSWGGRNRVTLKDPGDHNDYANWWKDTGVLWLQVESIAACSDARLMAKEGVDCISFGPMDLTFDIEAHPSHPFKTVDDCVRHVAEQLEGTGVAVCYRNGTPESRQKYIDMGVTVLLEVP